MAEAEFFAKAGQKNLIRSMITTDQETQAALVGSLSQVQKELALLDGPGIGQQIRAMQYQAISGDIANVVQETWIGEIHPTVLNGIREASSAAIQANKQMLAFLSQAAGIQDASIARSFYASSIQSWRAVQMRIVNKVELSQTVYDNAALMSGKIDDVVNTGIALGQSAAEIAARVEQYIMPEVSGGAKYAAQRLGRTELHSAYHHTTVESYKESPYVNGVEWHLSGSHPEDDECDDYDGQIFVPEEVPDPPHPNCFCYITAVTPTPEEFIDNLANGMYDGALNEQGLTQAAMCH